MWTGTRLARLGRLKVVCPSPPYVVPIKVNKVSFSEIGSVCPWQSAHPAGAKLPANILISPTYGVPMLVVSSLQSNTTYCTANETCVVACTVVVAPVTVMVKLPTGVERRLLPPQPASARRVIIPTTANNRRSFVFQLLRPPNAIVTSPRTGKANAAYKRRFGPPKNR